MFDLNAALLFTQIVRNGSFTAAARALGMPVSTVSDKVAGLEAALGVSLLVRTTRSIQLTEQGQAFLESVEPSFAAILAAGSNATSAQEVPSGVLKLSAPIDFATKELAEAVADYKARFPKVDVRLHFTNRVVDLIKEGYDLALRGGELDDASHVAKLIGKGHLFVVSSAQYLRSHSPILHPDDLKQHACIRYASSEDSAATNVDWRLRSSKGVSARVRVESSLSANSFETVKALVEAGAGVAFVPENLLSVPLRAGRMQRVLPDWSSKLKPVHLVYPAHHQKSVKVRAMVSTLSEHLSKVLVRAGGLTAG